MHCWFKTNKTKAIKKLIFNILDLKINISENLIFLIAFIHPSVCSKKTKIYEFLFLVCLKFNLKINKNHSIIILNRRLNYILTILFILFTFLTSILRIIVILELNLNLRWLYFYKFSWINHLISINHQVSSMILHKSLV